MKLPEDEKIEELTAKIEALKKEKEACPPYVEKLVRRSQSLSKSEQSLDLRLTCLEEGVDASKLEEQALLT